MSMQNEIRRAKTCLFLYLRKKGQILCYAEYITVIMAISLVTFIPIYTSIVYDNLVKDIPIDEYKFSYFETLYIGFMKHIFDSSLLFLILLTGHSIKFRDAGIISLIYLWITWAINSLRLLIDPFGMGNLVIQLMFLVSGLVFLFTFTKHVLINR